MGLLPKSSIHGLETTLHSLVGIFEGTVSIKKYAHDCSRQEEAGYRGNDLARRVLDVQEQSQAKQGQWMSWESVENKKQLEESIGHGGKQDCIYAGNILVNRLESKRKQDMIFLSMRVKSSIKPL